MTIKIPEPPKGMFTAKEWAEILKLREQRAKEGSTAVGE